MSQKLQALIEEREAELVKDWKCKCDPSCAEINEDNNMQDFIDSHVTSMTLAYEAGQAEREEEIVRMAEGMNFQMDIKEYLPKVKAWKGGYDRPFDEGYVQAKSDLITAITNLKK